MRRYSETHPYRAERSRQTKREPNVWKYRVRLTEQPDQMLAVILGDFLYDLRSALDHLAGAIAPTNRRYQASFPIEEVNIWKKDRSRAYLVRDPNRRRSFKSAVEGMPRKAVAIIKSLQPYNSPGDEKRTLLRLLSTLHNADKHRGLIVFARGVDEITTTISIGRRGAQVRHEKGLLKDGAPLLGIHVPPGTTESEVDVQIHGTATVAIEASGVDGYFEMPNVLEWILRQVEMALAQLEPFARTSHDRTSSARS